MNYKQVLGVINDASIVGLNRQVGNMFENYCIKFLERFGYNVKRYADINRNIKEKLGITKLDTGVDLFGTRKCGQYVAVQCKFRTEKHGKSTMYNSGGFELSHELFKDKIKYWIFMTNMPKVGQDLIKWKASNFKTTEIIYGHMFINADVEISKKDLYPKNLSESVKYRIENKILRASREDRVVELYEHKEKYGEYPKASDSKLGNFANSLRADMRKGKINPKMVKKFKNFLVGFDWNHDGERRDIYQRVDCINSYVEKYGKMPRLNLKIKNMSDEEKKAGQTVNNLRSLYNNRKMDIDDYTYIIKSIPNWKWSEKTKTELEDAVDIARCFYNQYMKLPPSTNKHGSKMYKIARFLNNYKTKKDNLSKYEVKLLNTLPGWKWEVTDMKSPDYQRKRAKEYVQFIKDTGKKPKCNKDNQRRRCKRNCHTKNSKTCKGKCRPNLTDKEKYEDSLFSWIKNFKTDYAAGKKDHLLDIVKYLDNNVKKWR